MSKQTTDGFLPVQEGSLYWKYDVPAEEDQANSSRPTVVLIHAGVADHTMWNAQVDHLTSKGWKCLRYDLFGYGRSYASDVYLQPLPREREPFDSLIHLETVRQTVLASDAEIIIVGMSVGSTIGMAYTILYPDYVRGLAMIVGGLRGFEFPNDPYEDQLFNRADTMIDNGDVQGAANMQVRIWGDGPLQEPGRLNEEIADRMLRWNIDISSRECAKTGGIALDRVMREQPPGTRLGEINVPTAVAYGLYDETFTTAAMKYVASKVRGATLKEFKTAHMINLEAENDFNQWLSDWLEVYFIRDSSVVPETPKLQHLQQQATTPRPQSSTPSSTTI